ncbi:unnamed protein product [Rhizophagus irregularis]|nr:unnamed protein product [Rhizophagus irregularis]CAB5350717.1 unnamed protein product [Rhizophagus irregularis]
MDPEKFLFKFFFFYRNDRDFQLLDTRELEPLVNDEESNSELDGCFWIIGRVGLQTLKYGNEFGSDFRLLDLSYKEIHINFGFNSWKKTKIRGKLLSRCIGFQILTVLYAGFWRVFFFLFFCN